MLSTPTKMLSKPYSNSLMKNEVFNGTRFWNYLKYDLTQMGRNHVRAAIGIGLMGLIFYVIYTAVHLIFNGAEWQAPGLAARTSVFGLACFALMLYQTRTYGYLTDKRKGSAWLMMPASSFEKWLSMLLLTLVVIPLLFFGASFLVDTLIAWLDPTAGESILHAAGKWYNTVSTEISKVNEDYMTTWNLGVFLSVSIASFAGSLLYFLLCGISFKRNKILGAFAVIFGISLLTSLVGVTIGGSLDAEMFYNDPAEAEIAIRRMITWTTASSWAIVLLLAGGIYLRIKTLKH